MDFETWFKQNVPNAPEGKYHELLAAWDAATLAERERCEKLPEGAAAGVQESTGCHYCDTGTEHEERDCMRNPPAESRRPDFENDAMRAYYATLQRHKIDKDNRTPDEVRRDAVMAAILAASDKPANG